LGKICFKNYSRIKIMIETSQNNTKPLKILIWLYFWLLIFEGALRKWGLPSLATPLLIVRDPIAIVLIYKSTQLGISWMNNYIRIAWLTTGLSFIFTLLFGHQNVIVAFFGLRIMFLHFPLIFIIANTFTKNDVLKMGKMLMLVSIPMTILIALQYTSPQSAWVNRGVGGDMEGSGFAGAMGYFRPSGFFSFTNGLTLFYQLCLPFILYYWISNAVCDKKLLYSSTVAYMLAMIFCLSRGLIVSSAITALFLFIYSLSSPKLTFKIIKIAVILLLLIAVLQFTPIFNIGLEVLMTRFDNAANSEGDLIEGSIINRVLGGMLYPFLEIGNLAFFEGNLGMGSNVGSKFLTGSQSYLLGEGEIGRIMGERGLFLGLSIIGLRLVLVINLGIKSWGLILKKGVLPWLIFSTVSITLITGQWSQTSALGFAVLSTGLLLAYFNSSNIKKA